MPIYDVKIKATVIKTIQVEAENEKDAIEDAHASFTVASEEGIPERYDQETMEVKEVNS